MPGYNTTPQAIPERLPLNQARAGLGLRQAHTGFISGSIEAFPHPGLFGFTHPIERSSEVYWYGRQRWESATREASGLEFLPASKQAHLTCPVPSALRQRQIILPASDFGAKLADNAAQGQNPGLGVSTVICSRQEVARAMRPVAGSTDMPRNT